MIRGRRASDVAESVETLLAKGRLTPGDPLPPVRELAATLRVSPTTIAAAYRILRSRGLVEGRRRGGTRVAPSAAPVRPRARAAHAAGVVDLASGNPDPDLLPSLAQAIRLVEDAPASYAAGPSMVPALTGFVRAELDADGIPEGALTVTAGALDAIERVLREHLRPGDRVAVEDPGYPGVLDLLRACGYVPVPFAVDDDGPVPGAVEQSLRQRPAAIVVTPRAQNPTGAVLTGERAAELRRLLARHLALLVVENDPAAPVAGAPAATLCDPARPRWAVVRSVSKFLGPDLRVAFVVGDLLTIARVDGRLALGMRWVSRLLQQLVLQLWSDPSSGRRLARVAGIYRQRREALIAALGARGIPGQGRSGLNVWVPVREEAHTCQQLIDRGWAVAPGERFRLRSPPAIRVTAAALRPEDAERFAADLADVYDGASAIA